MKRPECVEIKFAFDNGVTCVIVPGESIHLFQHNKPIVWDDNMDRWQSDNLPFWAIANRFYRHSLSQYPNLFIGG